MTPKMRKFTIEFRGSAEIELDEKLITRALTEEWRSNFYDLATAGEVASHVAYNLVTNAITLKQMDGFADLSESTVKVVAWPEWEVTATKEG